MPGNKEPVAFDRLRLRPFDDADDGALILGASVIGRVELVPAGGIGLFDAFLLSHASGYGAAFWQRTPSGRGAFRVVAVPAVEVARAMCSCGALVDNDAGGHMPWCRRRGRGHVRGAVK